MTRRHVMFVHAHPDDESSKGACTMARYAKEGHRVSLVTLTDGAAGDILNPKMDRPGVKERMVEIRREELARAIEILGVTDHVDLGYPDSGWVDDFEAGQGDRLAADGFYNVPLDEVVARLVRVIRETRPDVVVTYPPDGGYPHPDHIRCHEVTMTAVEAAADADRLPDAGPPHEVAKIYYVGVMGLERMELLNAAMVERGLEPPYAEWLERRRGRPPEDPPTTRVEVSDFLELRSQALLAHATQIDPDGGWFAVPESLVREVAPYEEFVRVRPAIADGEALETSLLQGLGA
jgi:mycothiol S-conjugate amidase